MSNRQRATPGAKWRPGDTGSAGEPSLRLMPRALSTPAMLKRNDGFILLAALWIVGMLATLAVIYSLFARQAAIEFVLHDERLQAESLAKSGVELAVYELTADPNVRPSTGQFSFRQGIAEVRVGFLSENSLIDLNFAPRRTLAGLFQALGAEEDSALSYADRILAWRTPLSGNMPDGEALLYQAEGKNYGPRHGPFQHINELALIAGLPQSLIKRALKYLTVYSGRPEVNLIGAPAEVLAALPGVSPALLQFLQEQRDAAPQDVLKARLGIAANYVTMQPSAADRINVDVQLRTGFHLRTVAVVLLLDKDTAPYRVLSWRDTEDD